MDTAPRWFQRMAALTAHLSQDFLGGPKVVRLAWVINAQKAGTALWVLALMALTLLGLGVMLWRVMRRRRPETTSQIRMQ